jgi:starch synthase (maltosyl-transferring)
MARLDTMTSAKAKPATATLAEDGRARVVIDAVRPSVDGGRFAVKRVAGDIVLVEADCFTDGHDVPRVMLRWRGENEVPWNEIEMTHQGNDLWHASFTPPSPGRYLYTVMAWVDHFESWRHELERRVEADDIRIAAQVGAELIESAAARAKGDDKKKLTAWANRLRKEGRAAASEAHAAAGAETLKAYALDVALAEIARRHPDRSQASTHPLEMPLVADRERARYSSWYEIFPRSTSPVPGRHGTFRDVEARLPYVAELGFDVLYFPPIHPVGRERRKGKNNALVGAADDVGSPWAIGAAEGGHKDILPELGTHEDFRRLAAKARDRGIEIALDIAFQCAPDHPYVKAHPQWFRWRPDGSVQYAENPPKKYQDIYPFNFESEDWRALWDELKSVFDFWIGQGVKIFRVDNPHTKAFAFWEWAIGEIKRAEPEVIFLAEAFTRPKVMHRLAKLGFTQSYTYFTWRNTKHELSEYFTELAHGKGAQYFRPNAWPNTPDILNEHLQHGGRPIFMARLVLAATLSASYGIYGPAYELMENAPREPGSEEYLHSEKYQIREWDLDRPDSLRAFIARVNRVRSENPALHANDSLRFLQIDNDQLIAYAKVAPEIDNVIVTIVNLDPSHPQSGWLEFNPETLGVDPALEYQMHDLLTDQRFLWHGTRNFVLIDPQRVPAHVFRVRRRVRHEQDFDYFV